MLHVQCRVYTFDFGSTCVLLCTYVRRWKGIAPGCLGPVLEAMEHSGEVRKMSEWSLEGGGGGWVSWGIGMLGQPLSWAWNNYVSPKKEVTKSYTGDYILLAPVKVSMDIVCTRRDNYNSLASDICQANISECQVFDHF